MDVIDVRGKSIRRIRKVYVVITLETRQSVNYLLMHRKQKTSKYVFARYSAGIDETIQGKYSIVQCHPEALLETTTGAMLLDSAELVSSVKALVIDECHKVQSW